MSAITSPTPEHLADIRERVARGVVLLDEKRPGWDAQIDIDELDIDNCWDCVIGQLYRSAWNGEDEPFEIGAVDLVGSGAYLFDNHAPALVEHGFSAYPAEEDKTEYDALTVEWRRVISERRSAATGGA